MAEADDELERWFRLEFVPEPIRPPVATATSMPRHVPALDLGPPAAAGAAVASALARSRELHGGWRWSPEQKRLKVLLRAQQQVGRELDRLIHVGARVVHARRAPNSAQPLDHVLVSARGVFVVTDVIASAGSPIGWHTTGHLAAAGISMRPFEESLVDAVRRGIGIVEELLDHRFSVPAQAVTCVVGGWPHRPAGTSSGLTVCAITHLRDVIDGPSTPALLTNEQIALVAYSFPRAYPPAAAEPFTTKKQA